MCTHSVAGEISTDFNHNINETEVVESHRHGKNEYFFVTDFAWDAKESTHSPQKQFLPNLQPQSKCSSAATTRVISDH